jgi:hypothetical protein
MGKRKADEQSALSAGKTQAPEENWLQDDDPLAEALRIDDLRSEYCQQLENRIAELTAEVKLLRALLRKQEQPEGRSITARLRKVD